MHTLDKSNVLILHSYVPVVELESTYVFTPFHVILI